MSDGFHHVSEIMKDISSTGSNDFSKLRYWKMIEQQPNTDTKKKTSGFWKVTEFGKLFVNMKVTVPKYALIYNKKKFGFSDEQVSIIQALGKEFNYQELMSNVVS